jgi:hypothetical protein
MTTLHVITQPLLNNEEATQIPSPQRDQVPPSRKEHQAGNKIPTQLTDIQNNQIHETVISKRTTCFFHTSLLLEHMKHVIIILTSYVHQPI